MLSSALLLLALAAQQPTQQPTAAPAKPQVNASQQADSSKGKRKHVRRSRKAKPATAPRDTTKSKP
jgi:hypothetical protein